MICSHIIYKVNPMEKKEEHLNIHWQARKPLWFLRPIEYVGAWLFSGPFGSRTKFNHINKVSYKEPSLIFSNHASFIDFPNVIVDMFPRRQCWVISIEEFNDREFLMRGLGGLAKRKFTNDVELIKHIVELIKVKKISVVIYPEARFSLAGINEDLGEGLGRLVKMCECPVIVFNQKGNFLRSPQWNKRPYRNVRVYADVTTAISKEDALTMDPNEIQERIEESFIYDEYRWQFDNKIKIKSKYRAKNIHKILYKCPECGNEHEMDSDGTSLWCNACGAHWDMDEYGELHQRGGVAKYPIVSNWYRWERDEAIKEVNEGRYSVKSRCRLEKLTSFKHGFKTLGFVNMTHDENGYTIEGTLDDGSEFYLNKPCLTTRSMHIEYDYKGRGDALDIATIEDTWFLFPLEIKNCLTKFNFVTEALYFKAKAKANK